MRHASTPTSMCAVKLRSAHRLSTTPLWSICNCRHQHRLTTAGAFRVLHGFTGLGTSAGDCLDVQLWHLWPIWPPGSNAVSAVMEGICPACQRASTCARTLCSRKHQGGRQEVRQCHHWQDSRRVGTHQSMSRVTKSPCTRQGVEVTSLHIVCMHLREHEMLRSLSYHMIVLSTSI